MRPDEARQLARLAYRCVRWLQEPQGEETESTIDLLVDVQYQLLTLTGYERLDIDVSIADVTARIEALS